MPRRSSGIELSLQRLLRAMVDTCQIRILPVAAPVQTRLCISSSGAFLLLLFTLVLLGNLAGAFRLCSSCWSRHRGILSLLDEYLWAEMASRASNSDPTGAGSVGGSDRNETLGRSGMLCGGELCLIYVLCATVRMSTFARDPTVAGAGFSLQASGLKLMPLGSAPAMKLADNPWTIVSSTSEADRPTVGLVHGR